MQTIETKVIPATNTKAARVRATHTGNRESITVEASSFDEIEDAHKHAAALLLRKLDWDRDGLGASLLGGGTKTGMVWVFEHGSPRINSWTLRKLELEHDLTACGDNPHGG